MSGDEDDIDREEGVNFSDLEPVLEEISYPITKEELVEEYGDHTVERTSAEPITLEELFAGTGEDTFDGPDGIQQSVLNLMPRDSVGRSRYSDRGGSAPGDAGSEGEDEDVSL